MIVLRIRRLERPLANATYLRWGVVVEDEHARPMARVGGVETDDAEGRERIYDALTRVLMEEPD